LPQANPSARRVQVGASGRIVDLDFCQTPLAARPGYDVSRPATIVRELLRQLQNSNLVVMDSPWFLDNQATPTRQGLAVNMGVVALGKSVLPRAAWQACSAPPQGPPGTKVVHFRFATRLVPRSLFLSASFRGEHAWMSEFIEAVAK